MSEEGDIDVESAEDVPDIAVEATATTVEDRSDVYSPTSGHMDKRAHHNALERRRRDHIKDSFHSLRDSIPSLSGEKISRAHILNKATDYIRVMQKSGSTREQEIQQLKRRNEVLEEQVRALEAARALGSTENAEDILQSVAEKVESKQRQQQQQQQQNKANSTTATTSGKSERNNSVEKSAGGKAGQQTTSGGSSKHPTPVVVKSSETTNPLTSNHMSILAKNQSLLSALQKNLSSPNLPASIKSLAARVLAAPLGRTQVSASGNIPRGIVTATTVPKGSSFTSSPLPNTLQQQQQAKTNQTHTKSVTGTPPKLPTANTTPSTNEHTSLVVVPNCTKSPNTRTATLSSPDKAPLESPSPHSQTTNSDSSKASPAVVASSASSSSLPTSANSTPITASSPTSQLLDAHSLLKQQGAGGTANSSPAVANSTSLSFVSPELLAQVSSFLNVPGQNSSLPDASEIGSASESADQDSLSTDVSLQGIKRPNSSQELDSEHSVKKIHLEA